MADNTQRHRTEERQQGHRRPPCLQRSRDPLIHRPHVGERLLGIDRPHRRSHGANQRLRVEPGLEDERHHARADAARPDSRSAPW